MTYIRMVLVSCLLTVSLLRPAAVLAQQSGGFQTPPVTLAWNPSVDATVIGYVLYYGNVATGGTNKMDVGLALTATVTNLQSGNTYFFFATAYDATRTESDPSNLVLYSPAPVATLGLQTIGQGTISPNYSNAVLEVGKTYSMTATAIAGHLFSNWTTAAGAVLTNSPTLSFVMQSNLVLRANFADVLAPLVAVTNLVSGARLSNSVVTIAGTASDNASLARVQYRLNNGGWQLASGLANWAAGVTLTGVSNTFQYYAEDTAGNRSATNLISFTYVINLPLALQTTGAGTISPNYSNTVLELGKAYAMTATAAAGFAFTNWTDGGGAQLTNGASIGFVMQSNLVLRANFGDVQKPVLTITSPTSGARFTNAAVTVTGTASDNLTLAKIQYQLNGGNWQTAAGLASWSANLTLPGGTNTVQFFAEDAAGNRSTTNTLSLVYVLTAPLSVIATGVGTVSPNYSNAVLELGKAYTMTATAAAGYAFTNWTDGVGALLTNSATISFVMQSNLVLKANFGDAQKPTLAITSPTNASRFTNASVTVTGTASDNVTLAKIQYQLNGGSWQTASGLTAWSANLALPGGTNTVQFFAEDAAGNRSTTNTLSLVYVLTAPLTVIATGVGTVSPNYSNAVLELGKAYTMTATAAAGYAFTNWTDGVGALLTNGATISFVMQSNLVLRVNFVDSQRPVLSITSPTDAARFTNANVIVTGTASDSLALARVQYQLNGGNWQTAAGLTTWSASLNLSGGTNTLQVFAEDTAGNRSLTNTLTLVYALTAPLTLTATGGGTISPNYSNAVLELGKAYAMTATATAGYAFTNWTDGVGAVLTNGPTISFLMQSNLALRANFVDAQKPMLTISSPTNASRFTNASVTVTGTASDNVTLAKVQYQLNGGNWQMAAGLASWSANLTLPGGTNTVQFFAEDAAGNHSTTNTLSLVYVLTAPLSVIATGVGTVSPNYSNAVLELGKAYTMTATAAAGYAFTNWTDGVGALLTNGATISFVMQSNLVLKANFGDAQKPTLAITSPTNASRFTNASVTVTGTASDNVTLAKIQYQLNGGSWQTASGLAAWSANLALAGGINTLQFYAEDAAGNRSVTNNLSVTYAVSAPLIVQIAGEGTVSPDYNNVPLELGKVYSMTATAGAGYGFSSWMDGNSAVVTNNATVSFVMRSNLVLRANFGERTALEVQVNEKGAVSPNYNGAVLDVGKLYSMTATASAGYAFSNWTDVGGSEITNSSALSFLMQSNLVLRANFADIERPALTVTNLVNGARLSNEVASVAGRASDNEWVAAVRYQLNDGDWEFASGLSNWSAGLSLVAGSNVFRVYAEDAAGNRSVTNTIGFTFVVMSPLTVQMAGMGTISPNYQNALLEIGKAYSTRATAGTGYVFSNWTDTAGVELTNGAAVAFLMQSNLTLRLNLVDTQKPVLTVTNLSGGQRVSNAVMTVAGRVTDNGDLAAVRYQLNNDPWQPAVGLTNWSADLGLTPGTNVFKVYAEDVTGNRSLTNSITFSYVVYAPLTVQLRGKGTLSPDYLNASLELGKAYSTRATAATGYAFSNWTDSAGVELTNGAAIAFLMQSNLTLGVNFWDVQNPALTVTNLGNGQRLSNAVVSVAGRVSDNGEVAAVRCQLNGGDWWLAGGTTNWSALFSPLAGSNVFRAYAEDVAGNRSPTNTVPFTYVVMAPLVVEMSGQGTLSPNYSNAFLEIGKAYTMAAPGANGYTFRNWTDGDGIVLTNAASLSFVMQSNLVLRPNLVDSQLPVLTILTPANGARLSNTVATITGRVTDNAALGEVRYQLNSGAWLSASGLSNWTASVNLLTVSNVFRAYAQDAAGNRSLTNSVAFTYAGLVPLVDPNLPSTLPRFATNQAGLSISNGYFQMQLSAASGVTVVIERSTNLVNWLPVQTNKFASEPVLISVPMVGNGREFFRGVLQ